MAAEESVIINTLLVGAKEFVGAAQAETAAILDLGAATGTAGNEAVLASKKFNLANQAMFTARRVAYAGTLALLAAGAAVIHLGWSYTSAMQQASVALRPVFASTKALNDEMSLLFRIAAYTPFQFKDITIAFRQMYAGLHIVGIGVGTINDALMAVINTLSFTGKDSPMALNRVSVALQHMANIGHLTGQVMLQLARDGLQIAPALRKSLGLTEDQLKNVGALGITSKQVLDAIIQYAQTTPGIMNAAFRQATKTLHGAWTTFLDLLSQAAGTSERGVFGGLQRFLFRVDKALVPFTKGNRQLSITDFMRAIDSALTPNSHAFLNFFMLLSGVMSGLVQTLKAANWSLSILGSTIGIFGGTVGGQTFLVRNFGKMLGYLLGVFLLYKVAVIAATIAQGAWWLVMEAGFITMRLISIGYGLMTAAQWLWNFAVAVGEGEYLSLNATLKIFSVMAALTAARIYVVTAATALWDAVTGLAAMGVAGLTLAWEAFTAALMTNPLSWIAMGIIIVITGLVLLYRRWKPFHDIVNKTWHDFIFWAPAVAAAFTLAFGPLGLALTTILLIIRYWNQLKGYTQQAIAPVHPPKGVSPGSYWKGGGWNPGSWPGYVGNFFSGLADGGTVRSPGLVWVGENGPELLHLPMGATVSPTQKYDWGAGGMKGFTVKVYPQNIYLDSQKIGSVLATAVTDREARQ